MEVEEVAAVEADLGSVTTETVDAAIGVARGPVQVGQTVAVVVVVVEYHDVAAEIVLDVQGERVAGIGVGGIPPIVVSHVAPVDLHEGVTPAADPAGQMHASTAVAGIDVGPEGSHHRHVPRESGCRSSAVRSREGDVSVVVDVERVVGPAVELEVEPERSPARGEVVVGADVLVEVEVAVVSRHQNPGSRGHRIDGGSDAAVGFPVPYPVGVEVVELPTADRGVTHLDLEPVVLHFAVGSITGRHRHRILVRAQAEPGKDGHGVQSPGNPNLELVEAVVNDFAGYHPLGNQVTFRVGVILPVSIPVEVDPATQKRVAGDAGVLGDVDLESDHLAR